MSSWFKKPINRAVTAVAIVIAIMALTLLIIGVTHHHEEGLLEVCWVDGDAQYVSGAEFNHGACERPEELRWPIEQIPITVSAFTPEGGPLAKTSDDYRVLDQAIRDINMQLRFELLRMGSKLHTSSGEVWFGTAYAGETPPAGFTAHRKLNGHLRGRVFIRADISSHDRTLFGVCKHELLHLVGLKHDDFPLSTMFPIIHEDWNVESMIASIITDHDVGLLQKLYKRN